MSARQRTSPRSSGGWEFRLAQNRTMMMRKRTTFPRRKHLRTRRTNRMRTRLPHRPPVRRGPNRLPTTSGMPWRDGTGRSRRRASQSPPLRNGHQVGDRAAVVANGPAVIPVDGREIAVVSPGNVRKRNLRGLSHRLVNQPSGQSLRRANVAVRLAARAAAAGTATRLQNLAAKVDRGAGNEMRLRAKSVRPPTVLRDGPAVPPSRRLVQRLHGKKRIPGVTTYSPKRARRLRSRTATRQRPLKRSHRPEPTAKDRISTRVMVVDVVGDGAEVVAVAATRNLSRPRPNRLVRKTSLPNRPTWTMSLRKPLMMGPRKKKPALLVDVDAVAERAEVAAPPRLPGTSSTTKSRSSLRVMTPGHVPKTTMMMTMIRSSRDPGALSPPGRKRSSICFTPKWFRSTRTTRADSRHGGKPRDSARRRDTTVVVAASSVHRRHGVPSSETGRTRRLGSGRQSCRGASRVGDGAASSSGMILRYFCSGWSE